MAGGKVRALASLTGNEIRVELEIAAGWHVNSNRPLQEELVATALTGELGEVRYPEAETVTLGFQQEPLEVWSRRVAIEATAESTRGAPRLELRLQACNDRLCLEPETAEIWLPPGR